MFSIDKTRQNSPAHINSRATKKTLINLKVESKQKTGKRKALHKWTKVHLQRRKRDNSSFWRVFIEQE
jgi:hypothetical protein